MDRKTLDDVLANNFNEMFVQHMKNAMCMSCFKYGNVTNKQGAKAINRIEDELKAFAKDGNLEHMVNVANWAMMRVMFPQGNEQYKGTDVGGSTRKEYKTVFEHLRDYVMAND